MSSEQSPPTSPPQTNRITSPPPQSLRQRVLARPPGSAEASRPLNRRRSSILSESFSETRKSMRSSTDDLLLPRLKTDSDLHESVESSHWHSLPLALALLPAVGGLFFKDGSAVITDVTLLGLAAIFMNWALRMPWEWYHAAQSAVVADPATPPVYTPIEEVDEQQEIADSQNTSRSSKTETVTQNLASQDSPFDTPETSAARQELRTHEVLALISCFAFPALAAWLLHGIRSQLSRPSEGLVSDYNLTIFLLVAEIRPFSHLIKMIQKRTLFLQRKVSAAVIKEHSGLSDSRILDLTDRIGELESHVANGVVASEERPSESNEAVVAKASIQATVEVKKVMQPELDALNRAMRRYEKRTTLSAIQIEARLQDLEARLKDVVVLAAAAQRTVEQRPKNYVGVLVNYACAVVVLPIQYAVYALTSPLRMANSLSISLRSKLLGRWKASVPKENKISRRNAPRVREQEKRSKTNP